MRQRFCVGARWSVFLVLILMNAPAALAQVPTLDEMAGEWKAREWQGIQPSARNFHGQLLTNDDLTSVSWLAAAPISQGYHSGTLSINGEVPLADEFRWFAYQVLRRAEVGNLRVESSTRMIPEENGILWRVHIRNTGSSIEEVTLDMDAIGILRKYTKPEDWQWWYRFPSMDDEREMVTGPQRVARRVEKMEEAARVRAQIGASARTGNTPSDADLLTFEAYEAYAILDSSGIIVRDRYSDARTAFAFRQRPHDLTLKHAGATAQWTTTLHPGAVHTLEFVMAYGDDEHWLREDARRWAADFDETFDQAASVWKDRWESIFQPGNDFVSGNIPVLETADENVRRVYYMGPVTALYLLNTGLPVMDRVYLTGGPRWGASIMFYWDITEWHALWAMMDPAAMKQHLLGWLRIDIDKYYGRDYYGGEGVGNGYVANYWAIFQMLYSYLTVTGDYDLLDERVAGTSVLDHMEAMAWNWRRLSKHGEPGYEGEQYEMADFGDDPWNLLEAVPTYIHIVPSFNAGYVWMMRSMADIYRKRGLADEAQELEREADALAERVLDLYAGEGYWHALYPDEKRVQIRHTLDFSYVGRYLHDDLTPEMKAEMVEFLERELLTDTWMRAQSLGDPAAADSDRPDHGPLGAFDGWPADAMESLAMLGYYDKAAGFYRRIEPVTREGAWAQAHELFGPEKETSEAMVRIAGRDWHNRDSSAGIAMSSILIRNFFGFIPGFQSDEMLHQPDVPRGIYGTLRHVPHDGAYYSISSTESGLHVEKE